MGGGGWGETLNANRNRFRGPATTCKLRREAKVMRLEELFAVIQRKEDSLGLK
jgi:hypothetical protein